MQDVEFFFAGGDGIGVDAPLGFEDVGEVGVVVEGEAVGVEGEDGVDGGLDACEALVGQAVYEVDADGFEAGFAGGFDDGAGFFDALDAVDGLLHFGVKVLDADAHAVKAEAAEVVHGFAADFAWVDFDGVFAVGQEVEVAADHGEDAVELAV